MRRRLACDAVRAPLLDWYRPRRLAYPWRAASDPYAILVSEVMLQQTQAARVVPSYSAFLRRFPTVTALASAPRRHVVDAWAGLGHNRRAVALSEAARALLRDHGGRVPSELDALRALPGVGAYTAAAVASIAFGRPVAAIDTNAARIVARVCQGVDAHGAEPVDLRRLAEDLLAEHDPGAWNQALMDLGREICRPRPRCPECPLRAMCRYAADRPARGTPPRKGEPFEGSSRQVRGRIVQILRSRPAASLARLSAETGFDLDRVTAAVASLVNDGLLDAGPAALAGRPAGRVRIAG